MAEFDDVDLADLDELGPTNWIFRELNRLSSGDTMRLLSPDAAKGPGTPPPLTVAENRALLDKILKRYIQEMGRRKTKY